MSLKQNGDTPAGMAVISEPNIPIDGTAKVIFQPLGRQGEIPAA